MELQRGVCILCADSSNKVLNPLDASDFIELIPFIINNTVLLEAEFQKLKTGIKLCTICCYKIKLTSEIKKTIKSVKLPDNAEDQNICRFCKSHENLIRVRDWKHFQDHTDGIIEQSEFPLTVCPRCSFYFDALYRFKRNLFFKFPQLKALPAKSPVKPNLKIKKRGPEIKQDLLIVLDTQKEKVREQNLLPKTKKKKNKSKKGEIEKEDVFLETNNKEDVAHETDERDVPLENDENTGREQDPFPKTKKKKSKSRKDGTVKEDVVPETSNKEDVTHKSDKEEHVSLETNKEMDLPYETEKKRSSSKHRGIEIEKDSSKTNGAKSDSENTHDTPKRKSQSKSPPSAKKRKIFNNCFTYLQPLSTKKYNISRRVKKDQKLYKEIPYVDMFSFKTPKSRPVIKIKFKGKKQRASILSKKEKEQKENVKRTRKRDKTEDQNEDSSKPVGQLGATLKPRRPLRRQSSVQESHSPEPQQEEEEEEEEKDASAEKTIIEIEETPKTASVSNLVPKRRVSMIIESTSCTNDEEGEPEEVIESPPPVDEPPAEPSIPSTIIDILKETVEQTVPEESVTNATEEELSNKLDLFDEIDKNVEESEKFIGNGVADDLQVPVNGQDEISPLIVLDDDTPPPLVDLEPLENDPILGGNSKDILSETESPELLKKRPFGDIPMVCDYNSSDSPADEFAKDLEPRLDESDSLNGSERKKKRVHFSDDVN